MQNSKMHPEGFEPSRPKRTVDLKSNALDHSAMNASVKQLSKADLQVHRPCRQDFTPGTDSSAGACTDSQQQCPRHAAWVAASFKSN